MFAAQEAKPAAVRALWLIPVVFALGALGSHLLLPALHAPAAALAQPAPVVTGWGVSGIAAWALYAATIAAAGACYLAALAAAQRGKVRRSAVVAAALLSTIAAFAFRFMFSSDVYAYAAYGALAATGADPYVHRAFPPTQLVDAHWTAAIGYEWPSLPACIYGQGFVEIARGIVLATHFDLAHAIVALRVLEILAFGCALALAPNVFVATVVGLNPVVLSTVAEGHNDALVLLAIALAYAASRRRVVAAGVLAALSALLKATGGMAALALAYALGSRRFAWGVFGGLAIAIGVQLGATALSGGYQPFAPTDFVGTPQGAVAIALRGIAALVFAAGALHAAAHGFRARTLAASALALWALYPNDYPWYGMWLLPLAAYTAREREGRALVALTFSSTLRYLSDVYGYAPAAPWLEVVVVAVPLCVFAWRPAFAENLQPT